MNLNAASFRSLGAIIVFLLFLNFGPVSGKTCYVDALNGSDANAGTSISLAWKTLAFASRKNFSPGDSLLLKRDAIWNEGLQVNSSGVGPIVIGAWGTGAAPVIRNDSTESFCIELLSPAIVESLTVLGSGSSGIFVTKTAGGSTVHFCEVCSCGVGIELQGHGNIVRGNYIHDLKMVINTPGGNDDYGAVGVLVENSRNEVCGNRMVNCRASSYDYGSDGGVVEFFGTADSCLIYGNIGINCDGFTEVGGGSAVNSRIACNISVNNGPFLELHLRGSFASTVRNLQVDNNTVFDTVKRSAPAWAVIGFDGNSSPSTLILQNNIIEARSFYSIIKADSTKGWSFAHLYNLYYLDGASVPISYALDSTERIANPLFANTAAADFHLAPGSPAIGAGIVDGDSADFYGIRVTGKPSLGAVAYSATGVQRTGSGKVATPGLQQRAKQLGRYQMMIGRKPGESFTIQGRRIIPKHTP